MFQEMKGFGPRGVQPFWSADEEKTALEMWGNGYSARQIAEVLGYSRSAVLGKLHRMRNRGTDTERASPRPRQASSGRKATAHPKLRNVPFVPALFSVEQIQPSEYDANCRRITLMETGPLECRYIVDGEGADALYCGTVKPHDRAFCDHHFQRCFYKPRG